MYHISSERKRTFTYGYRPADLTVAHIVADKAEKNGDRPFLTFLADNRCYSYREMHLLSNRFANGLADLGVAAGSHVGVIMENSPEQVLFYFAIAKLGAVAVPLNTSAKGLQLAYFLQHGDITHVIADHGIGERLAAVADDCPLLSRVILFGEGALPGHDRVIFSDLQDLHQASDVTPVCPAKISTLAMLMYTSGTTGPSKANMLAQSGVVQYGMTTAEAHGYRADDIVYVSLPLSHANAYLCTLWGAFVTDGQVALAPRFSVSRYWDEVRACGATITNMLGSMPNMIWSRAPSELDAQNKLRICNMVPVPAFARDFEKRFGLRVISSYGQTDFASATVFTTVDPEQKLGSSGRARPGIEMAVVDENDMPQPRGVEGELVLRTANHWSASMGYYKNPEATAIAARNGWWHTGDHCFIDDDGFLYFAARKKDSLRRRGENISVFEVEAALSRHPDVLEAAVYGVKMPDGEDEVAASVILKDGAQVTQTDLLEYCIRNMAHYMVPRFVELAETLPRTDNFKVRKEALKAKAADSRAHLWDREDHGIYVSRDVDALQFRPRA